MYSIILSLIVICAIILIFVVLLQNAKGGGMSGAIGGGFGANQIIGVKRTSDLLEKLTWGFAVAIMALVITSSTFIGDDSKGSEDLLKENILQENTFTPTELGDEEEIEGLDDAEPLPEENLDSEPEESSDEADELFQ